MFSNWELTVGGLKVMQHALAIASLHGLVLFPGSPLHMGEPRMKLLYESGIGWFYCIGEVYDLLTLVPKYDGPNESQRLLLISFLNFTSVDIFQSHLHE